MKTYLTKLLFVPALLALLTTINSQLSTAHAQGTAFTYQGQLQDGGSPANGIYDLKFTLLPAGSGTVPILAVVTNTAVGVTNGLFTTTIDFSTNFPGANRWLAIAVRTNGTSTFTGLTPRQPITPTPYAITAGTAITAESANGLPGLTVQQNADNAPNVIGGSSLNYVAGGVEGAAIGGGGSSNDGGSSYSNSVTANFGTVGGGEANTASGEGATVSGGYGNIVSAAGVDATVAGGGQNTATLQGSVVGGGQENQSTNLYATVSGGLSNTAGGPQATVPGGEDNLAAGSHSFAAGFMAKATNNGAFVWADGQGTPFYSTTTNQFNVRANGGVQFVTGGAGMSVDGNAVLTTGSSGNGISIQENADDAPNVIGGSSVNFVASGVEGATIGGGGTTNDSGSSFTNSVTADFGTVAGGLANAAIGDSATVAGGFQNDAHGFTAMVGGGQYNFAYGDYATVGGGNGNTANGVSSTVAGGGAGFIGDYGNIANGFGSFIGGGGTDGNQDDGNIANGNASMIGGGLGNTAGGDYATVGGGYNNSASDYYATVGGGRNNQATNSSATVPGGKSNIAGGQFSFAAGQQAQALHQGAFVWADSQNATFSSTANDQFLIRAQGGVGIGTGTTVAGSLTINTNVYLDDHAIYLRGLSGVDHNHGLGYNGQTTTNFGTGQYQIDGPALWGYSGGLLGTRNGGDHAALQWNTTSVTVNGTFNNLSDRNAKQDFTTITPAQILAKVTQLPLSEWSYKMDVATRHIGPMAQDFYAAFNVGTDNRHIAPIDENGVALAAIQGLNEKVESGKQKAEIQMERLAAENAALQQQNDSLARRLEKLEQLVLAKTGGAK